MPQLETERHGERANGDDRCASVFEWKDAFFPCVGTPDHVGTHWNDHGDYVSWRGNEQVSEHHDPVNHPPHYNAHPEGIECIQVTRWMNFNRGNAVKYIWRAGAKGDEIEDLRKAVWYLQDEIARLERS